MFKKILSAGVSLAATLAVVTVAFAGARPDAGTADVDIIVANYDDTDDAPVHIQYYSTGGTEGPYRDETLDPLHAGKYTAASAGFTGSFQGVAVVSSELMVGVVGTAKWAGGEATDGLKFGQYAGVTEVSDVLYFPNVVYDTAGSAGIQNTVLSVQNSSGSAVTAYVSWTNLGGDQDFRYSISVPGNGAVTMDTSNWDTSMADNVPNLPSTGFWSTWDFWSGGVVVTSTQSVLAGAANVNWRQWAASYAAVNTGATTLYFPSVERREYSVVNNGRFGGGSSTWGGLSALAVTNLDLTASTEITFTFTDSLGMAAPRQFTLPLAAGGTVRLNTHSGAKIGTAWYYDHDDLKVLDRYPTDASKREWVGSVIVESAGPSIVGTCNNLYLEYNKADLYEAVPDGSGHPNVAVPDVYRVANSNFSLLRIQNLSGDPATINAHFYDRSGNDKLQFVNYPLDGYEVATPNMNRSCFGDGTTGCTKPWETTVAGSGLGSNFMGWILFTSNQPIVVTVENWFGGASHYGMGAYNGLGFD
jgi:hypothetical protein